MKKIDYLIIGQGLAGSLLAWELIQRGQKVLVIDNNQENASLVAAGLINPVTGMRLVKSTDVDLLLPFATHYYHTLSQFFKQPFYIKKPMLRLLRNNKELLACQKRLDQAEYQSYLSHIIATKDSIKAPQGILIQQQTGYLLTQPLLAALKTYFLSINAYQVRQFDPHEIKFSPYIQWQNLQAKNIIFCEGHLASHNPWFSWLPFQLVKGEIITASSTDKIQQSILNYGHWYIPLNDKQFRTGATFDREQINTTPTETARQELLSSLQNIYPDLKNPVINKHQAGIRPATEDKQPFIGHHPKHKQLLIFNGFGAKGSLQIPQYCHYFANHLLKNTPIPISCNILRYS